eukprot:7358850-Alexandrium_andersonii.AAC.1
MGGAQEGPQLNCAIQSNRSGRDSWRSLRPQVKGAIQQKRGPATALRAPFGASGATAGPVPLN